jgi:hypothetical protein
MSEAKDWIVIVGNLISTINGGGLEFLGPLTEAEAMKYRDKSAANFELSDAICIAVQLLPTTEPVK